MHYTNPAVAAIIPLYNGERYIRIALESVLNQKLRPAEIIVVNDGSNDDGPLIVEQMAKQHPIKLLHKTNGGQSSARNWGVAHSSSELIALLDQDDVWYANHLEGLVDQFRRAHIPEMGFVYSNLDEIDAEGRVVVRSCLNQLGVQHPKRDLFSCIRSDMFVLPSASLIARKAFDDVAGFDERLSGFEDDDLFLRMFRAGYDNFYVNLALTQWRIYTTSASFSPRMARSRMVYFRKLVESCPDDPARGRFLARDFIAPRFFPWLVREYTNALARGDRGTIRTACDDLEYAASLHKPKVRIIMRMLLPLMRMRKLASACRPLLHLLRPAMRWALR